jgi:hypothetical protein
VTKVLINALTGEVKCYFKSQVNHCFPRKIAILLTRLFDCVENRGDSRGGEVSEIISDHVNASPVTFVEFRGTDAFAAKLSQVTTRCSPGFQLSVATATE